MFRPKRNRSCKQKLILVQRHRQGKLLFILACFYWDSTNGNTSPCTVEPDPHQPVPLDSTAIRWNPCICASRYAEQELEFALQVENPVGRPSQYLAIHGSKQDPSRHDRRLGGLVVGHVPFGKCQNMVECSVASLICSLDARRRSKTRRVDCWQK